MAKFKIVSYIFWFVYIFEINTTKADSSHLNHMTATGLNCKITEPLYNTSFDFNDLRSELAHVVSYNTNEKFEFNICGNLSKSCRNVSVAACYSKMTGKGTETEEIILGHTSVLSIDSGRFDFKFSGDKCTKTSNYTLHIIVHCDYQTEFGLINVVPYSDDTCSFYIFWATKLACLPEPPSIKTSKCSVKDVDNQVFNLMSLSHVNNIVPDRNNSNFIINVCKPVLFSHEATCPVGSSICFIDKNNKNIREKFRNIGTVVGDPIIKDGIVMMKFESNEKCNATHNITSSMIFPCSRSMKISDPEFLDRKGCEYKFIWNTHLTCKPKKPCIAVNPITEQIFNLTTLSGKLYEVKHQNLTYEFGICDIPKNTKCYENAGICLKNDNLATTLGLISNVLYLNETGWPYLLYESGSNSPTCKAIGQHYSTKIEFICAKDSASGPKIIENKDCEIIIQFSTDLACPLKQIKCDYYNSENIKVSLEPLMSSTHNYKATVNQSLIITEGLPVEYHINVCRPLVPQYSLNCHGSAACRAINNNITAENELGLGFADLSLTLVDTPNGSRPQLKYLRGDKCPEDVTTNISTTIEFYCDPKAGKGIPILQEIIDQCHYSFQWPTNIICPVYRTDFKKKTCEIYNAQVEKNFDLTKIPIEEIILQKSSPGDFNVSICQSNDFTATVNYEESCVDMYFKSPGPCSDGIVDVTLKVVCYDEEQKFVKIINSNCNIIITLKTKLICPFIGIALEQQNETSNNDNNNNNNNNNNNDKHNDDKIVIINSGISATGLVLLILFTITIIGAIIYVIKSPHRRSQILSLFRRQNVGVQYTRIRTNEEASLLLPQPGNLSDSDEDLLI